MTRTSHAAKLPTERRRVVPRRWFVVATVAAATALAPLPTAVGAAPRATWPMHRSDLARTGTNPSETTISPANASALRLDWSAPGGYRSSPAVSGGIAYLSCERADVCAVDASTGRPLWRTTVGQTYAP